VLLQIADPERPATAAFKHFVASPPDDQDAATAAPHAWPNDEFRETLDGLRKAIDVAVPPDDCIRFRYGNPVCGTDPLGGKFIIYTQEPRPWNGPKNVTGVAAVRPHDAQVLEAGEYLPESRWQHDPCSLRTFRREVAETPEFGDSIA
jgi:hypothetical protein